MALVAVFVVAGVAYQQARSSDGPTLQDDWFCGGVGLFGPAAATPEDAVAAWVRQRGGDPDDYDKLSDSAWDVPDSDPHYERITVNTMPDGTYSVDGACVKGPDGTTP